MDLVDIWDELKKTYTMPEIKRLLSGDGNVRCRILTNWIVGKSNKCKRAGFCQWYNSSISCPASINFPLAKLILLEADMHKNEIIHTYGEEFFDSERYVNDPEYLLNMMILVYAKITRDFPDLDEESIVDLITTSSGLKKYYKDVMDNIRTAVETYINYERDKK